MRSVLINRHLSKRGLLTIGRATYGRPAVWLYRDERCKVSIGSYCSIAHDVELIPGGNHRLDWVTTYPIHEPREESYAVSKGDILIGNDVWLGRGTKVLSGVRVGDGAVCAAYSVVTTDVPPYTIVAGLPARPIGTRFEQPQIDALLRIAWWDWPEEKIRANSELLWSPRIDDFIERFDPNAVGAQE